MYLDQSSRWPCRYPWILQFRAHTVHTHNIFPIYLNQMYSLTIRIYRTSHRKRLDNSNVMPDSIPRIFCERFPCWWQSTERKKSQVTYEQVREGFKSILQCREIVFYNLPAIHSTNAINYCPVVSECNTGMSRRLTNTEEERLGVKT